MEENVKHHYCLNCGTEFPFPFDEHKEYFCSNCGQSSKDSRLSFGRLIKDAISNVFNLDSRLIHTFRDILYPSKLTRFYIEGKRKYYVNPARLFIFMLIGLITLALYSIKIENSAMGVDAIYTRAERSKLLDDYVALRDSINIIGHEEIVDSIESRLFKNVNSLKNDTLGIDAPEFFDWVKPIGEFGISTYDAIHLTQEQLFDKYEVDYFWDKINVGQYIRIVTNPAGGIKHVIKNLTWAVFVTVLLMGFFLKIIYIRSSYYLVEHVVLILNSHSLLFVIIAINIVLSAHLSLGDYIDDASVIVLGISILIVLFIQFLSLKRYYRQGIFKTFIKQLMINAIYIMIFNTVAAMVALISLILY
ncbi:MAG: DUF3667 domain-containing protein [Bacteroidota bacterium]